MEVAIGMPFLVLFMGVVMGWPYAYFLSRDKRYADSKGQPDDVRLKIWYGH